MYKDYMFKPRTQPMATYKKSSSRYKEITKARAKQRIKTAKEWLTVLFIVFICSVDLEPLLDILLR